MAKIGKLSLHGVDWEHASAMGRAAAEAVQNGQLGYAVITAGSPGRG